MSDDGKTYNDPEMEKFFTEHRDMIERILAQERDRASAAAEDVRRETESRMAYEREMAKERLAETGERAYNGYRNGREQAEGAFNEGRDHLRQFSEEQTDYAFDAFRAERERARRMAAEERDYAMQAAAEERARVRAEAERQRARADEAAARVLTTMTDPQFQQHLMGAGMEMFMAINSLIRASPLPDSFKEAADQTDRNKNTAYCRKNPYCEKKAPGQRQPAADNSGVQKIDILPKEQAPADSSKDSEKKE